MLSRISFIDVCTALHIESSANAAFCNYQNHILFLKRFCESVSHVTHVTYRCLYIYQESRRHQSGLTLEEVCFAGGGNYRKVWVALKNENSYLASSPISVEDIFRRSERSLYLSPDQRRSVKQKLRGFHSLSTFSPKTLVAFSYFTVMRRCDKSSITIKKACQAFNVSPATFHRFKKRMKDIENERVCKSRLQQKIRRSAKIRDDRNSAKQNVRED